MKMHKFYGYERKLMVVDFFQMDRSSVPLVDFCLRRIIILLKKRFDLHSRAKSHVKISFFVLVTLRSIYIYIYIRSSHKFIHLDSFMQFCILIPFRWTNCLLCC